MTYSLLVFDDEMIPSTIDTFKDEETADVMYDIYSELYPNAYFDVIEN